MSIKITNLKNTEPTDTFQVLGFSSAKEKSIVDGLTASAIQIKYSFLDVKKFLRSSNSSFDIKLKKFLTMEVHQNNELEEQLSLILFFKIQLLVLKSNKVLTRRVANFISFPIE